VVGKSLEGLLLAGFKLGIGDEVAAGRNARNRPYAQTGSATASTPGSGRKPQKRLTLTSITRWLGRQRGRA
jgi:hypothetical protein